MEEFIGKAHYLVGRGSREKEGLSLARDKCIDLLDIMDKSHIHHTISLIQDEDLYMAEIDDFLIDEVE